MNCIEWAIGRNQVSLGQSVSQRCSDSLLVSSPSHSVNRTHVKYEKGSQLQRFHQYTHFGYI